MGHFNENWQEFITYRNSHSTTVTHVFNLSFSDMFLGQDKLYRCASVPKGTNSVVYTDGPNLSNV